MQILGAPAQGHWRLASTSPASSPTAHRHRYRKEVKRMKQRLTMNPPRTRLPHGHADNVSNLLQRTSCLAEWALLDARPRPPLTLWRTPVAIFNCAVGEFTVASGPVWPLDGSARSTQLNWAQRYWQLFGEEYSTEMIHTQTFQLSNDIKKKFKKTYNEDKTNLIIKETNNFEISLPIQLSRESAT